jgi:hypothetical protein
MPVTAARGFELPKTVYFLVEKVQYDENARLMRYIGAFSNLSDCAPGRSRLASGAAPRVRAERPSRRRHLKIMPGHWMGRPSARFITTAWPMPTRPLAQMPAWYGRELPPFG